MPKNGVTKASVLRNKSPKRSPSPEIFEVERVVAGPRILDGAYLIKWVGFPDSQNTWEPRCHLPDEVFEDDSQPLSFPFEVIATATASANAAALAAHKLALTPKPARTDDLSSESSDEGPSSNDEWVPGEEESHVHEKEPVGGDTDDYPDDSSPAASGFAITARKTRNPIPQTAVKKAFNDDFTNLEKMYRTKQNSRDLAKAAEVHGGCPKLRFRSNFNTTRAAGSMYQHTVALRLKKVIGYFELENPDRVTHNFVGDRWIELAEIQAIESVSGGLTMKCQVYAKILCVKCKCIIICA